MTPFNVQVRARSQVTVAAPGIVKVLDPGGRPHTCPGLALEAAALNEFAFKTDKDSLGCGAVVGVARSSLRGVRLHQPAPLTNGQVGTPVGFTRSPLHKRDALGHSI